MELPEFESKYKPLFEAIRKVVPHSMKIYLVGGAVRDIILDRNFHDFDFCVEGLVRPIGKHIANELGGAYYVLDDEREMVRIIIDDDQMGQFDIDISLINGDRIEDDLVCRDFTFNAMAIKIAEDPVFIDPLNGYADLQEKRLRMCSADSLDNDPLRALRAIRMCLEFELSMDNELLAAMEKVPAHLSDSSMERYRDEMFKIIRLYQNGKAAKLYEHFGFLDHLFPDWDKYTDTLNVTRIENTDQFALLLTANKRINNALDDFSSYAASRLGNYKEALRAFFEKNLALYHNRRMLMIFASVVKSMSDDEKLVQSWCSRLTFSISEMNFVNSALMSLEYLNQIDNISSCGDVEIYRFFRQFKEGGIAGLILYLSENYALQDIPNAYKEWCDKVVFVQDMVSAYFTRYMEVISPKSFMSGHDIQELLNAAPGPIIGFVKNALVEAQIRGSVKTLEEAESFVRQQAKHYK